MSASSWHAVRVYYYGDPTDLLLRAVRPLLSAVGPAVEAAYFQRHWLRGPHVRLFFKTAPDRFVARVRPAIEEHVGGYLAAHPSTTQLDESRLLAAHRKLAEAEEEEGPLTPWLPDNSVHEVPYDDRARALGSAEASGLVADFFVATNELALETVAELEGGAARLLPCFDLLVATANEFSGRGLLGGFVSFRSHAEGFLALTGRAESLRARWDERYESLGSRLEERAAGLVARLEAGEPPGPPADRWLECVRPVEARGAELVDAGRIALPGPETRSAPDSPFHQRLLDSDVYWEGVRRAPWFLRYRLTLNFLHLHLTRIGIARPERFLLCHFVANAAERLYGVTAEQLVRSGRLRPPGSTGPEVSGER